MSPRIQRGLLDYGQPWSLPTVKLFTGNSMRRSDGSLVMGAGAARAVRDRWPSVARDIQLPADKPLAWHQVQPDQWLGWFQTKRDWRDPSDPSLIAAAARQLATAAAKRPNVSFELNAPGIGHGGLSWAHVAPLLEVLPSNVIIYRA